MKNPIFSGLAGIALLFGSASALVAEAQSTPLHHPQPAPSIYATEYSANVRVKGPATRRGGPAEGSREAAPHGQPQPYYVPNYGYVYPVHEDDYPPYIMGYEITPAAVTATAPRERSSGWEYDDHYFRLSVGPFFANDSDAEYNEFTNGQLTDRATGELQFNHGLIYSGAFGVQSSIHNGFAEMEVSYLTSDGDKAVDDATKDTVNLNGDSTLWTLMANGGFRGFSGNGEDSLKPYLAAGFGIARADGTDDLEFSDDNPNCSWVAQLKAGLEGRFAPNLTGFVEYRFLRTGEFTFDETTESGGSTIRDVLEYEISGHALMAGLKFSF